MADQEYIYKDEKGGHFLYETGPEDNRTVHLRVGRVHMELFRDDAETLYRMLGKWREQTPGLGWDDDPLAIRGAS